MKAGVDVLSVALYGGLPAQAVHVDEKILAEHSRDAAPFSPAGTPAVVVEPVTVEQVRHVMHTAHALRVPVVPQGALTGLAGAANASDGCIALSLRKMARILEVDAANRLLRCEPGATNAAVSAAAREHGLFFPPDPASTETCTIGGNIATGAGGLCCVKYGVIADYVLGLDVVLADGTLLRTGHRTMKGVAGYDLTHLFVGSEGTLGVVVGATLALRPMPSPSLAMLAQFSSAADAGAAVAAIVANGHTPSALELMDGRSTRAVAELGHPMLSADAAATLIVDIDTTDPAEEIAAIAALCRTAGASSVTVATSVDESDQVLAARRMVLPAMQEQGKRMGGNPAGYIEDVAVPLSELAPFIREIEEIADRYGLYIATVGHAGDGNLHPTVVFDQDDPEARERAESAYDEIMAVGLRLGGTITGEHGVGVLKRNWLRRELGPTGLRLHEGIKQVFDPAGILNPGKVISPT